MLCQAWQGPDGAMDQIVQVSQKIYKKFEHMICKNECVLYIESMAIGKAMPRGSPRTEYEIIESACLAWDMKLMC